MVVLKVIFLAFGNEHFVAYFKKYYEKRYYFLYGMNKKALLLFLKYKLIKAKR